MAAIAVTLMLELLFVLCGCKPQQPEPLPSNAVWLQATAAGTPSL
jgi:hypothetical protein